MITAIDIHTNPFVAGPNCATAMALLSLAVQRTDGTNCALVSRHAC